MEKIIDKRVRADYSAQLSIGDQHFDSVIDFCQEYGLGYRTVLSNLKKGRTGEEIVQRMLELPDVAKPKKDPVPVIYEDKEYTSIAEACRETGTKRRRVNYYLRQGFSPADALKKANLVQIEYEKAPDGRSRSKGPAGEPCTIDGVHFRTRKDACEAFHVSYPTVMSRMQRNPDMSFEEALLRGARKWKYVAAEHQPPADSSCYRYASENGDEPEIPLLLQVEASLASNDYGAPGDFPCRWDDNPERWVIGMKAYLHPPRDCVNVEISCETCPIGFIQPIHFSVPDFFRLPVHTDLRKKDRTVRCLELINKLQEEYAGVALSVSGDTVRASYLYYASGRSHSDRQFMYALHRFLGTAAEMQSQFQEEFREEK